MIRILAETAASSPAFLAFTMPGGPEWIFILLIVLLLFGAKKLPELARGIGASIGEFKRAKDSIEQEIKQASEEISLNKPKGLHPHRPAEGNDDAAQNPASGRDTPA